MGMNPLAFLFLNNFFINTKNKVPEQYMEGG